ncbi:MAG TPA: dienelactone hydrolase family protein [Phycisphaerae bacterium]|nr:dienelactone hydrolase family protein [Phycisphaerae bacterium]
MHALGNRSNSRKWGAISCIGIGLLLAVEAVGTAHADEGRLPNASPLVETGDLAMKMVAGIDKHLLRQTEASVADRERYWHRDFGSTEAYLKSVEPNRAEFARIVGVVDPRREPAGLQLIATTTQPSGAGGSADYTIDRARWPVFDGVDAEGLLLQPKGNPVARVIALPDADWTPEMLVGLAPGVDPACQYARRLAENGCLVLVPTLVDRGSRLSGNPSIRMTNIPHREFIYRMAYQMGRHIIGYEVQKVLAAVDCFHSGAAGRKLPIGVFGYGEGGLLALYAAAIDRRIDAACVSGYFQSRAQVWAEPVYRNVWNLLREFGDAEIASLVAPRPLVIEAGRGPEVGSPPPDPYGHSQASSGRLVTPPREAVLHEFNRAQGVYEQLKAAGKIRLVFPDDPRAGPGTEPALQAFLAALVGRQGPLRPAGPSPVPSQWADADVDARQARQFGQLVGFTQRLVRESGERRRQFWSKADASSLEKWQKSCEYYRRYLWDEVIGRCPAPGDSINPRSRRIIDNDKWAGYEVVLDVYPDVFAYGILLLPKDIRPGERRPVVVCQHGLEGRPNKVVDRTIKSPYKAFGADLADRGYIVFAPQNPYIGGDAFRLLQRKANPLKLSLFSFITAQHRQILLWLGQQPFVDPKRIAFYGLSYGGKTAMRVPALLPEYCLSICSGDFNEWIVKTTSVDLVNSYMFTYEYEIYEFDMGNTFNYGELAGLIAPRPFMVERGHDDPVGMDEWVSYEYAKVRRLYAKLGLPDLTEIEYFDGRHEIHAVGTFAFLHKHLARPR